MAIKVNTSINKALYQGAVVSIRSYQHVHSDEEYITNYTYNVYADETLDTIICSGIKSIRTSSPDMSFEMCYSDLKSSYLGYINI